MNNNLQYYWNNKNPQSYQKNIKPHKTQVFIPKLVSEKPNNQLNTFMKKSIFETLVERVMSDDELNVIGADKDAAADDNTVIENSDTESSNNDVTITLSAEQIECLRNILAQVDDSEGDDESFEDEFEDENSDEFSNESESEDEEFNAFATEAIEAEEVGTPLVNQKKGNPCKPSAGCNKVNGKVTSMAKAGKADASITDKVGNDVDEGTPLVNQKKGNPKKPSGGDNKVAGKASQVGSDLFA